MPITKTYYRRNLPHWVPDGKALFITCRLKGTLPERVSELFPDGNSQEKPHWNSQNLTNKIIPELNSFARFQDALDYEVNGPTWLKDDQVAQIWFDSLKFYDAKKYDLVCSTIMSNHVHFIIDDLQDSYSTIMRSTKGFSAYKSNKHLGRNGAFWTSESFDRWIRNDQEMSKYIRYILNNPVKVGLVNNWQDYKFNYINPKYKRFL